MPQTTCSDISKVFNVCFCAIGGNHNPDVADYFSLRNQVITRQAFFERALWAVWVSGMSRKAASAFLDNVKFDYNFDAFAALDSDQLAAFVTRAHPFGVTYRAYKKWLAIHTIASWLTSFDSDADFRARFFAGKTYGDQLDGTDVQRIFSQGLPFIRSANSHFIVKNFGGQVIKCDRWIREFLNWGKLTQPQLESLLRQRNIPLSLFDTVVWSYCEMFVVRTATFSTHFAAKFGSLCVKG